jgi:hypothetical protein
VSYEATKFHAWCEIVPFFQDEFVLDWRMGRECVIVGMVKIVGYKFRGFEEDVDVFGCMTFQGVSGGYPKRILL